MLNAALLVIVTTIIKCRERLSTESHQAIQHASILILPRPAPVSTKKLQHGTTTVARYCSFKLLSRMKISINTIIINKKLLQKSFTASYYIFSREIISNATKDTDHNNSI